MWNKQASKNSHHTSTRRQATWWVVCAVEDPCLFSTYSRPTRSCIPYEEFPMAQVDF